MKRAFAVLLMVLCSSVLLAAQGKSKDKGQDPGASMMKMTGHICYSKCVKTEGDKSVCDGSCTETSGDMVLVDDAGKVIKIANPKKIKKNMMGKSVKVKGKMTDEDTMYAIQVILANAG